MKRILKLFLVAILLSVWVILFMTVLVPLVFWLITRNSWVILLSHDVLMKLLEGIEYNDELVTYNYRVFRNGKATTRIVVNSPSEEEALKVYYRFNETTDVITVKDTGDEFNIISLFYNYMLDESQID